MESWNLGTGLANVLVAELIIMVQNVAIETLVIIVSVAGI